MGRIVSGWIGCYNGIAAGFQDDDIGISKMHGITQKEGMAA